MLGKYNFKSIFKEELDSFIKYKRTFGYDYINEIYKLNELDRILYDLKLKSKTITKETFSELVKRNNKQDANYARYYGVVKDFCIYLISNDYKNIYYENKRFHIVNNYMPVMFNDDEIKRLLIACDKLRSQHINDKYYQSYYSYSIIIRLLYACGLRRCEALKIYIQDIDFNQSIIRIIDSKRHSSRIVVMSDTMRKSLENYIKIFNINEGLIFTNCNGNSIRKESLRKYFKKALQLAELNVVAHMHDLRHTFANKAFNQMLEKGYDENVVIVYLYKYMGHKTIAETEYYLHFTDYNKKKIINNNDTFSKSLYEGIDLDNE